MQLPWGSCALAPRPCAPLNRRTTRAPLRLVADIPMPGTAVRFDYQSLDPASGRLYIAHMNADQLVVFDTRSRAGRGQPRWLCARPRRLGGAGARTRLRLGHGRPSGRGRRHEDAEDARQGRPGHRIPTVWPTRPKAGRVFVSDEHGKADAVIDVEDQRASSRASLSAARRGTRSTTRRRGRSWSPSHEPAELRGHRSRGGPDRGPLSVAGDEGAPRRQPRRAPAPGVRRGRGQRNARGPRPREQEGPGDAPGRRGPGRARPSTRAWAASTSRPSPERVSVFKQRGKELVSEGEMAHAARPHGLRRSGDPPRVPPARERRRAPRPAHHGARRSDRASESVRLSSRAARWRARWPRRSRGARTGCGSSVDSPVAAAAPRRASGSTASSTSRPGRGRTPIGPLRPARPDEGAPASEETEVRVLFDADNLYVGITCRDRDALGHRVDAARRATPTSRSTTASPSSSTPSSTTRTASSSW